MKVFSYVYKGNFKVCFWEAWRLQACTSFVIVLPLVSFARKHVSDAGRATSSTSPQARTCPQSSINQRQDPSVGVNGGTVTQSTDHDGSRSFIYVPNRCSEG